MGRPAFTRFLNGPRRTGEHAGVRRGDAFATWDDLLAGGRERSAGVVPGGTYAVDPEAGLDSFAALFAVATVPGTALLWASPGALGVRHTPLAPGLARVGDGELHLPGGDGELLPPEGNGGLRLPERAAEGRPLWGVRTSGSSGSPKLALGHADEGELIALHTASAVFSGGSWASGAAGFPGGSADAGGDGAAVFATCLPLGFSAAFFMSVLPALYLRQDLLVFAAHDWSPLYEAALRGPVRALAVPALATAACLANEGPVDMEGTELLLGGGYVTAPRVEMLRSRFRGVRLANLYGTAESSAVALDRDPGHNQHVGPPIPGKSVWLTGRDERGVGAVSVAGPGCCRWVCRPGEPPRAMPGYVVGTDNGRFDAEGNLCLEGRLDGGEKVAGVLVYPRETERHLLALGGVSDVRVTVEHRASGLEFLAASVIGDVAEAAVREHCAALPEEQRPSRISCRSEETAAAVYTAHGKL